MFDGWFAGQRLTTTQRYIQLTANASHKRIPNLPLHATDFSFSNCLNFFFCCSFPLNRYAASTTQLTQWKIEEECLWLSFYNDFKKKQTALDQCEGGFCDGKISNQLTHQLAVAVIGERAIGRLLKKEKRRVHYGKGGRWIGMKQTKLVKKLIDFFYFEFRQESGLISSSGQDEAWGMGPVKKWMEQRPN